MAAVTGVCGDGVKVSIYRPSGTSEKVFARNIKEVNDGVLNNPHSRERLADLRKRLKEKLEKKSCKK
jgi:hypothetical protein